MSVPPPSQMAVDLSLTPGQLGEIWQAATVEEGPETVDRAVEETVEVV